MFLLFTLCIIITPQNSYSQACDVLTLKNDEIVFFFDGHYYRDGSTATICESSLAEPLLTIELQKYGQPSSAIEVKWLSGTDSEDNPSTISIDHFKKQGSFLGKKYMTNNIEASIVGSKIVNKFKVQLIDDCSLNVFHSRKKGTYGVDSNAVKGYPTFISDERLNKPYKLIPSGGSDEVVLKLKPSNTSIKNHLDIHTPEGNVSAEPILDPMGDLTQHTLNHLSDTGNDFDKVHICDHYAYNLVSTTPIQLDLEVYYIRESDDDEAGWCQDNSKPNYRKLMTDCMREITDKEHVCISPGLDGSLDLSTLFGSRHLKGDDEMGLLSTYPTVKYVKAGNNLTCDSDLVTNPNQGNTISYTQTEIESAIAEVNQFYSKYLINFNPIYKGVKAWNYDTYQDDEKLSSREGFEFIERYGNTSIPSLYFLAGKRFKPPIKDDVRGIGYAFYDTGVPLNSCFVLSNIASDALPFVIAHELAHTVWVLVHSDNIKYKASDVISLMRPEFGPEMDNRLGNLYLRPHDWLNIFK